MKFYISGWRKMRKLFLLARCSVKCFNQSFRFCFALSMTVACCWWFGSNQFVNWWRIIIVITVPLLSHYMLDEMLKPIFFFPFCFLFCLRWWCWILNVVVFLIFWRWWWWWNMEIKRSWKFKIVREKILSPCFNDVKSF